MKDEAELKILMGVEYKILMGDVVSDEIYNQPHSPKANFVKCLAVKKNIFLKDLRTWFFVSYTSIFNEWSFYAFHKFVIIYGALLVFKVHVDQINSWKCL